MILAFCALWQRHPWSLPYCLFAVGSIAATVVGQWVGVI